MGATYVSYCVCLRPRCQLLFSNNIFQSIYYKWLFFHLNLKLFWYNLAMTFCFLAVCLRLMPFNWWIGKRRIIDVFLHGTLSLLRCSRFSKPQIRAWTFRALQIIRENEREKETKRHWYSFVHRQFSKTSNIVLTIRINTVKQSFIEVHDLPEFFLFFSGIVFANADLLTHFYLSHSNICFDSHLGANESTLPFSKTEKKSLSETDYLFETTFNTRYICIHDEYRYKFMNSWN